VGQSIADFNLNVQKAPPAHPRVTKFDTSKGPYPHLQAFQPAMTTMSSEGVPVMPHTSMQMTIGALLIAILLNACLFGVVSQQFCSYWRNDFNDSKWVKIFVVTQFSIIAFQSIILWQMAWRAFVVHYVTMMDPDSLLWCAKS